ncbi:2-amino-4-hydroxy-6-hydroxymethyldihydropteridine diphosphokinase [Flectobacillus major]|uniref:2-amino-4-hydroxy-6- hydroxymethyldihydropteridine diphosphokinase n=1 Tax=Flectobacillus major TaxID=103 RepID=UPI000417D68F|nr:2-amino-4-hydroxy-6-hydroxymethyldihydropteridine diphosphokinase [Flectobacillus major]
MQEPKLQTVYLSLGSNLGKREENLQKAIYKIEEKIGSIISISNIYETAPWGNLNQAGFLNLILSVTLQNANPIDILADLQKIEHDLGRIRTEKWGERIIDIDIIYWDSLLLNHPRLTIPHPFMHDRKFVLVPLADIAPAFKHPVFGKTTLELLTLCTDTGEVLLKQARL